MTITRAEVERIMALAEKKRAIVWYRKYELTGNDGPMFDEDADIVCACDPATIIRLCLAALRGIEREVVTDEFVDAVADGFNPAAWDSDDWKPALRKALEAAERERTKARGET